MTKIRLSTIQLVMIIIGLCLALLIQHQQAVFREAILDARADKFEFEAAASKAMYRSAITQFGSIIKELTEKVNQQSK